MAEEYDSVGERRAAVGRSGRVVAEGTISSENDAAGGAAGAWAVGHDSVIERRAAAEESGGAMTEGHDSIGEGRVATGQQRGWG